MEKFCHIPVMKKELIYYLNIIENGIYIDCTFGNGGHSIEILSNLNKNGKLIVLDNDILSIYKAKKINDKRLYYIHTNFSNLYEILKKKKLLNKINGIVLDLGLSKNQIFCKNRGFSFNINSILDMRINKNIGEPAYKLLKNSNIQNIQNIFYKYGNEYKYSHKIAKKIFENNNKKTIKYTFELVNIIKGIHKKKTKLHVATKYFQAIRIYTNNEIFHLKKLLSNIINILKIGGRLIIITFNSLETKIIKNFFNLNRYEISHIPLKDFEYKNIIINNNYMKKIIKIKPTYEEINNNFSSRSSILTVFEKCNFFKNY